MKFILVALSALFLAGCGNTLAGAKTDIAKLPGLLPQAPAPVDPAASALGPAKVYYLAPPPEK